MQNQTVVFKELAEILETHESISLNCFRLLEHLLNFLFSPNRFLGSGKTSIFLTIENKDIKKY